MQVREGLTTPSAPQLSSLPRDMMTPEMEPSLRSRLGVVHRLTQRKDTLKGSNWRRKRHRRKVGLKRRKQLSRKKSISNHK